MYGGYRPPIRPFSMPPPPPESGFHMPPPLWSAPPMPSNYTLPRPPVCIPPRPPFPLVTSVPQEDPVESAVAQWLSENEARLRTNRLQQATPKIPEFRAKLQRWNQLLKELPTVTDPNLKEELIQIEQECSDPATIEKIQMKLRKIRRKRRNQKRRKQIALDSRDDSVVARSSVAESLTWLRAMRQSSVDPLGDQTVKSHTSEKIKQEDIAPSTASSTQPSQSAQRRATRLSHAVSQCNEQLSLLDRLEKLRAARLTRARQLGGLYPEALDFAFSAQLGELRTMLKAQIHRYQIVTDTKSETTEKNSRTPAKPPSVHPIDAQGNCCDHFPGLLTWKKHLLFCAASEQIELPWRCKRFYHQADFDFTDFLRIRFAWDAYLVPTSATQAAPELEASSPERDEANSQLPATWVLPPEVSSDSPWFRFMEKSD